jgi:hypothetical protein
MKNEKSKNQVNPDEVVKWFNVFSLLVNIVKSIFNKKTSSKKIQAPPVPSLTPNKKSLKNQNLNN